MELDEIEKMNLQVGERIEITLKNGSNDKWRELGYFDRLTDENDRKYKRGLLYSSENGNVWDACKKEKGFCLDSHIQNVERVPIK